MGDERSTPPSLKISNRHAFHCSICLSFLTIPVFACDKGHLVCSKCCSKFWNECHLFCSKRMTLKRCIAIENLLQYIEKPVKRENEEKCITPKMQIYVMGLYKTITLWVESSDTILNVKTKILNKERIPVHHQFLKFADKDLDDDSQTLAGYNIQEKTTLNLRIRFIGD